MANYFIPYIPKLTNKKQSSKLYCKGSRQIEYSSVPVKACPVGSDLPIQNTKRDNQIVVESMLLQLNICQLLVFQKVESGIA
jgi:hypothetical protein